MQDIVDKFDRAKELLELAGPAGAALTDEQQDTAAKELLGLGIDAVGELVASARRIAVALETIAENTKPLELTNAVAEVGSFAIDTDTIRPLVQRILADNGLVSPVGQKLGRQ